MPVTTRDAILGGKLTLVQPAHGLGYRMTQDAVLLAAFACEGPAAELAVDLGAGAGGVGLAVLQQRGAKRVVFVEIDPALLADEPIPQDDPKRSPAANHRASAVVSSALMPRIVPGNR